MRNLLRTALSGLATFASAGLMLAPTSSIAETLDFNSFALFEQHNPVMVLPLATITSLGTDIFVGAAGIGHEICALNSFSCNADMKIAFNGPVNNLSFVTSGWQLGDQVTVSAFAGSTLLGTVSQAGNGLVDLTGFANVTNLYLDDASTAAGMAYDQFNFSVAAVPEPETYAMLLAGLGLLGFVAHRRKLNLAA